jgi:hypothetical protein
MARIVVSGYMVRHPVAGNILAYFHYVLGFARLGHRVVYVEESGWPYSCYDPGTRQWLDDPAAGLRTARALMAEHDLEVPVCYVNRDSRVVDGLTWLELERELRDADLLINVGGVCWLPEFALARRRALIDLDPVFTQIDRFGARILDQYQVHFTYGANIGKPFCSVPVGQTRWLPTVPPVVTDLWAGSAPPREAPMTTVANWTAYGSIEHEGREYGQKDREFLRLIDVARHSPIPLELAISGAAPDVHQRFQKAGWNVRDAGEDVSTDIATYRNYILTSRGEFSAAKHAYVATRSGWFSDRSVCYLAAGRPVVLQDTGFTDWLPTDRGVLPFTTPLEALDALRHLASDYSTHAGAAASLAREWFAHDRVLPKLLETALERTPSASPPGAGQS